MPSSSSSSELLTLPFVPVHESVPQAPAVVAEPAHAEQAVDPSARIAQALSLLCPLPHALRPRDDNAPIPVGVDDSAEDLAASLAVIRRLRWTRWGSVQADLNPPQCGRFLLSGEGSLVVYGGSHTQSASKSATQ